MRRRRCVPLEPGGDAERVDTARERSERRRGTGDPRDARRRRWCTEVPCEGREGARETPRRRGPRAPGGRRWRTRVRWKTAGGSAVSGALAYTPVALSGDAQSVVDYFRSSERAREKSRYQVWISQLTPQRRHARWPRRRRSDGHGGRWARRSRSSSCRACVGVRTRRRATRATGTPVRTMTKKSARHPWTEKRTNPPRGCPPANRR